MGMGHDKGIQLSVYTVITLSFPQWNARDTATEAQLIELRFFCVQVALSWATTTAPANLIPS